MQSGESKMQKSHVYVLTMRANARIRPSHRSPVRPLACWPVSLFSLLREQAALGAAGVGLVVGAVSQRREGVFGEHRVAAVAGWKPSDA